MTELRITVTADDEGNITITDRTGPRLKSMTLDAGDAGELARAILHYQDVTAGMDRLDSLSDEEKICLYRKELRREADTGARSILAAQMRAAVGMA